MAGFKDVRMVAMVCAGSLAIAACGGSTVDTTTTTTAAPAATTTAAPATSTTVAPATTTTAPATTTTAAATTTTTAAEDALTVDGSEVTVVWASLPSTPFYAPAAGGGDPFFHIHTNPATDGFFLSFEMYTTGYGLEWTGDLGTFDISCDNATSSTGICPYFDPDGPGPIAVVGDDFGATGSVTINQLDGDGYDIVVHELAFTDGTTFTEFTMTG